MATSFMVFLVLGLFQSRAMASFNGFLGGYINSYSASSLTYGKITAVFDRSFVNCNSETMGSVVISNVNLNCINCPKTVDFICTDFSEEDNMTIASTEYVVKSRFTFIQVLINYDHPFKHTLGKRRYFFANTPRFKWFGTFGGPLVYSIYKGCNDTIKIPVDHLDDYELKCKQDSLYCLDMCRLPDGIDIISSTCEIDIVHGGSFITSFDEGMYAILLKVTLAREVPLTEYNALQIVLVLKTKNRPCDVKPIFVEPTPADGTCVDLLPGEVYHQRIVVQVAENLDRITEIKTTLLLGMTKTPLQQVQGKNNQFFVDVMYDPSSVRIHLPGARLFCFTGRDSLGTDTEPRCVKIIQYIDAMELYIRWFFYKPKNKNVGSITEITFNCRQFIFRPPNSTYLSLYLATNNVLVQKFDLLTHPNATYEPKKIRFTFPDGILEDNTYYVTLDRGAALIRKNYCKLRTLEYKDLSKTFTMRDMRPLVATFLSNFTLLDTANVTVHWKFNKVVTSVNCSLFLYVTMLQSYPDCGDHLTLTNLNDSSYILWIDASDKYDITTNASYEWIVDLTSPQITCQNLPASDSNNVSLNAVCNLTETASALCRLVKKTDIAGPFTPCNNLTDQSIYYSFTGFTDNTTYVFELKATDKAGNVGNLKHEWRTDFEAPHITCQRLPAAVSNATTADMICSCNENCSAVCRIRTATQTDAQYESCSNLTNVVISYSTTDLSDDMTYVFDALATDKSGNSRPFQFEWKTDHAKPDVTISKKPTSPTNKKYSDIEFSCNEACKTKCLLENGSTSTGFGDCGGGFSLDTKTYRTPSLVSMTNYTFKVIPTDAAGNEGIIQEASWEVDFDLPNCTIIEKPPLKSNKTVVNIKMSCNEPCEAKCSMKKQGESPGFVNCGGPATEPLKTYTTQILTTDAKSDFRFFCTDSAGNVGATQTWQWQTDLVKPICIFVKYPMANSSETHVEFTIQCNEATRLICTLKKGNHDPLSRDCGGDLSSVSRTFKTKRLESGYMYTFTVLCFDASGNVGKPISRSWFMYIKSSLTATLNMQIPDNLNHQDVFEQYVKKLVGPLKAEMISRLRTGSLIVDYDIDPSNWNYVLTLIERGNVNIDGAIVPVKAISVRQKDGAVLDLSPLVHPCVVYKEYKSCPAHAPCVADGNTNARCSSEFIETSRGVIGLGVGIVAFFVLVISGSLVVLFRKPTKAVDKCKETNEDSQWNNSSKNTSWSQPRYHNTRFIGMPSSWFGEKTSEE